MVKIHKLMRVLILLKTVFMLTGCEKSDKKMIEGVTRKYVDAMQKNDMKTMYSCYRPDIQAASKAFTEGAGNMLDFGISNAYETGLQTGGFMKNLIGDAVTDVTGTTLDWKYKNIESMTLNEGAGNLQLRYELTLIQNEQGQIRTDLLFDFSVSKVENEWYLDGEPSSKKNSPRNVYQDITYLMNLLGLFF